MPAREKIYRIGEAAALLRVKTSVLRFWETEFPELVPRRMSSGHRVYSEKDMQLLRRIRDLLYIKGLTIEGARQVLDKQTCHSGLSPEERQARSQELEERRKEVAERRREQTARRREQETVFLQQVCEELNNVKKLLEQGGRP